MPGDHGAACTSDNQITSERSIGRYLAKKFLQDRGTRFLNDNLGIQSPQKLVDAYSDVLLQCLGNGRTKSPPSTHRRGVIENSKREHPFYLNEHHEALVGRCLPDLARFLRQFSPYPSHTQTQLSKQTELSERQSKEISEIQEGLLTYPVTDQALQRIFGTTGRRDWAASLPEKNPTGWFSGLKRL